MDKPTCKQQQQKKTETKRKIVTITLSEKLKVIEKVESGVSRKLVAEKFGISMGQVSDIKRQATVIRALAGLLDSDESKNAKRITKKRSREYRLDAALYTWYMKHRFNDISLTSADFISKAEELKQKFGITDLVCNDNWLIQYRKRHNIKDSDVGITESVEHLTQTETSSEPSSSLAHEENVVVEDGEMQHFEIIVKEEPEMLDGTEWEYPTVSGRDVIYQQGDDVKDKPLSSAISAMEAARRGIDDVINYIGHTSNRKLWEYYEQLRVVRELIVEDQKNFELNSVQGVKDELSFSKP